MKNMYELTISEKANASKRIADALADGKPIKENIKGVPYYKVTRKERYYSNMCCDLFRLPACVLTDSPGNLSSVDVLLRDLERDVRLRLPTPVFRYLAITTDCDVQTWEMSPAKFIDKWRLAMLIAKGEATHDMILNVMQGGILYPIEEEYRTSEKKYLR